MYAMIGTWRMSLEGMKLAAQRVMDGCGAGEAVVTAIRAV